MCPLSPGQKSQVKASNQNLEMTPSIPDLSLNCRNALEDPWVEPKEDMFTRSVSPEDAPDKPSYIEIDFEKGDPIAINGARLSPAKLLTQLNKVHFPGAVRS